MDQETTNRFKLLLQTEKQRILTNSKIAINELTEKATEKAGDEGDIARTMAETHVALRFRDRENQLLTKIEEALEKIDRGTFGQCDDCNEDIGIKRLESRPVATLCIHCKEIQEKQEREYA